MTKSPLQKFDPDDLLFFALIHELMNKHLDKEMVNQAHKLALKSKAIRPIYVAGAWHFFDLQKAGKV